MTHDREFPDGNRPAANNRPGSAARLWVERISLTNFRNYLSATVAVGPDPVVLVGQNGAGKTNLLEALSLLTPGRGLRNSAFSDIATASLSGADWSVSARVHTALGPITVGTGLRSGIAGTGGERAQRVVRIDGKSWPNSGVLADYIEMVWLTPAMDGLFTGPASERRRFLDQLILCFDPDHRTIANRFDRAMQQRNRLLTDGVLDPNLFSGLEQMMAGTGVALAAARVEALGALQAIIDRRRAQHGVSPFPWSRVAVAGQLENNLATRPAVDVEDSYQLTLATMRERDRSAGRALDGPHRSDFVVTHGAKDMAARHCSTGEQKALLLGLVLAHAELVKERRGGIAPILLLDEVTAHLDAERREALFDEIVRLAAQAWLTGTDEATFRSLSSKAQIRLVAEGWIGSRPST